MNNNRIALLCLVNQQAIDDLFPTSKSGLLNEWVMWTNRIGVSTAIELKESLACYGHLNLYVYVKIAPNVGSVSFRASFSNFNRLDGTDEYRGIRCYSEFYFVTYETLQLPLPLSQFRFFHRSGRMSTTTPLRRNYMYVVDPAYFETDVSSKRVVKPRRNPRSLLSIESSYIRRTPEQIIEVFRQHDLLAFDFKRWLESSGIAKIELERDFIDVSFNFQNKSYLVELKITRGGSSRSAIRDALGQVLEYNHYYDNSQTDVWIILLDSKPTTRDLMYLQKLRKEYNFPLSLGWKTQSGFRFSLGPRLIFTKLPTK